VWWQHGAATESPEEAAAKRMTDHQFNDCTSTLNRLDLI
jgi:hypothetical protein